MANLTGVPVSGLAGLVYCDMRGYDLYLQSGKNRSFLHAQITSVRGRGRSKAVSTFLDKYPYSTHLSTIKPFLLSEPISYHLKPHIYTAIKTNESTL